MIIVVWVPDIKLIQIYHIIICHDVCCDGLGAVLGLVGS